MSTVFYPIVVLLPILGGIGALVLPFKKRGLRMFYIEAVTLINSALVIGLIFTASKDSLTVFRFAGDLKIGFRMDDAGRIFSGIVSVLWPLATLFSFEYMKHERHENVFFMFYLITYGVTMGIALAEGILTLYFFYEMLTMVTVPLVMHTLSREAILASRTYLYYSLGGAAFAFVGMVFVLIFGSSGTFIIGGSISATLVADRVNMLRIIYVLSFCGFSVKAAMFPFSAWLPKAGVAPTPVTALLHAVAVVKAGAFACIRLTYYSFGVDFLKGSWAQYLLMSLTIITIVYGCSRALKETHIKRRLAWSTVSNLSYILFGVVLMSSAGLVGAFSHMIFHAAMKICSFFCAGAIMYTTGKSYIHELDGLGHRMPQVFVIFTISGFALMGVPGLCGFISKWNLAQAAIADGSPLAILGVAALLISALLTAIYMLTISVRAFFPGKEHDPSLTAGIKDPNWMMMLPLYLFVIIMVCFGLHPQPLMKFLNQLVTLLQYK